MKDGIYANEADAPRVSVVIPAYNCMNTVGEAISSALAQTVTSLEVLVIDDCSLDDTASIITALAARDGRVRYIKQEKNMGVAAARNRGVLEARAEYVAFLDADDAWRTTKLEAQLRLCAETGCALACTGASIILPHGESAKRVMRAPAIITAKSLLQGNDIVTSSVLARRDALMRFPMERDELHEDLICWYRLLSAYGDARGIDEPLTLYRLSAQSKSGNKLASALTTWKTYKYLGIPAPRAAIMFICYALHGIRRYAFLKKQG